MSVDWLSDLHTRALREVTFQELRRGIQSLSARYVERRTTLAKPAGVAVQWAFAAFYGPLHFLTVQEALRALSPAPIASLLDLGCGTAAAGAAWACSAVARLHGIERTAWACTEARRTLKALDLRGDIAQGDLLRTPWRHADAILIAYTANELDDDGRATLLRRLAKHKGQALLIEPIARRALTWWSEWEEVFAAKGGRSDTWRFAVELPPALAELDHAAGLNHRELTARTLYLGR